MLLRNVGCPLSTALRADFQFRVHTTFLSISIEMLSNQQPIPDISHMMNGASTKEYGAEATPHLSMFLGQYASPDIS